MATLVITHVRRALVFVTVQQIADFFVFLQGVKGFSVPEIKEDSVLNNVFSVTGADLVKNGVISMLLRILNDLGHWHGMIHWF